MNNTEDRAVSVGDWILTFIILSIPIVNVVMLIVWAVSESTPPSKRNYAKAAIIIFAVIVVIGIVLGVLGGLAGVMAGHHHS